MIEPLTSDELEAMRQAGKVAAMVIRKLRFFITPGITTKSIETFFEKTLQQYSGMEPAFNGFMGYGASCCVSVNEEVIHGIPSQRIIHSGDIVSVDLGIKYKGVFIDTAHTYIVGRITKAARRLVQVTSRSLYDAIHKIKVGAHIGDVSSAVQQTVEQNGFSVIRKFVGHGIGRELHLPPEVPNFGERGQGPQLLEGQAIAVEPMVAMGDFDVEILNDGWTVKTIDNSLSAHFEHTIAVTKRGPVILTR